MPGAHNFEHLPLLLRYRGRARLPSGGKTNPQTLANRNARQAHSTALQGAAQALSGNWKQRQVQRQGQALPVIPNGIPILLKVDAGLDLDVLRERFDFEIVAEQEEGYVIVASEDIDVASFLAMVNGFAVNVHGSATIASIHQLFDDPNQSDRLSRILSERLFADWGNITDDQDFIVDVGIACAGTQEIPSVPKRGKRDTDASWAAKELAWSQARNGAYDMWEALKIERENQIESFRAFYQAEILHNIDGAPFDAGVLPDSFTVRLKISGKGLKDFVLNYPYIFEVVEPEDIVLPQAVAGQVGQAGQQVTPTPPTVASRKDMPCCSLRSIRPRRTASCPKRPPRRSLTKSRQADTEQEWPELCCTARKYPRQARRDCPSGSKTRVCSMRRTSCPSRSSRPKRCGRLLSVSTTGRGRLASSIIPSTHAATAARATCRRGLRRSTSFATSATCLLCRAQATFRLMEPPPSLASASTLPPAGTTLPTSRKVPSGSPIRAKASKP
jgi:hypothetical protein